MADDLFGSMAISAAGMSAQRKRMEAIAENIANAESTRGPGGEPYRPKRVEFRSTETMQPRLTAAEHRVTLAHTSPMHLEGGSAMRVDQAMQTLEATKVEDVAAVPKRVYDPHHPDADPEGYVQMPDVNTVSEMVDMVAATKAYEANLAAMKAYRDIVEKSLEI